MNIPYWRTLGIIFVLMGTISLLAACDGSAATEKEDSGPVYQQPDTDCASSDSCIEGCATDADCPPGQFCIETSCRVPEPDGDEPTDGDQPVSDGDDSDGPFPEVTDVEFDTGIPHNDSNPWIVANPNAVEFGAVPLLDSRETEVNVKNVGQADLIIDEAYIYFDSMEDQPELTVQTDKLPLTLLPGEDTIMTLRFVAYDMDPDSDILIIGSNDPSEPHIGVRITTEIKATPVLAVDPLEIDFGTVRLGRYTETLNIRNIGGVEMKLFAVNIEQQESDFALLDVPNINEPFIIPAFDSIAVTVELDPADADPSDLEATITVEAGDDNVSSIAVPVTATVCEPQISALPTALNFSSIQVGDSAVKCTVLSNEGCWDLTIDEISIFDADDGGNYTWLYGDPQTPVTLEEDGELELCVKGTPTINSDNNAIITVISDDPAQPELIIPLSGDDMPNTCPTAMIWLDSPPVSNIHPNDLMLFNGAGSFDPNDGDSIQVYMWSVLSRPQGSSAVLSSDHNVQTSFTPDLSGAYTIRLRVMDSYGMESCVPADFSFTVLAPEPAVIGHIQNVMTGGAISGVYWEMMDGSNLVATSAASGFLGNAPIEGSFPTGTYTGHVPSNQAPLNSYTCPDVPFNLVQGVTAHVYFSCQPVLPPGAYRLVLHWDNWQQGGADLDAHLYIPGGGHLYYSNRSVGSTTLDHDGGIQGFNPEPSPETVTISSMNTGTYCFSIHDYNRASGPWRGIGAYVEVFDNNGLVTTIQGPSQGANGGWWHVIRINGSNGSITTVDQLATSAPSCN